MFRPYSSIFRQLPNLSELLHCIFNVIKINYFLSYNICVFHFRQPLVKKKHLLENVFMHCLPSVTSVFCVLFVSWHGCRCGVIIWLLCAPLACTLSLCCRTSWVCHLLFVCTGVIVNKVAFQTEVKVYRSHFNATGCWSNNIMTTLPFFSRI
jgi:hypothetical protein